MKSILFLIITLLGVKSFACGRAQTEVNDPAKDKENSDLIIVGTIDKKEGFEDPKTKDIYTNIVLKNIRTLKGENINTVTMQVFGGTISYSKKNQDGKSGTGFIRGQAALCASNINLSNPVGEKWLICLKKHKDKKDIYVASGDQENCQIQDIPENEKK
ncbi:hypothetical protein K2X05_13120 [bacterium]|nr:hypothetical protein [bacterium]